MRFYLRNLLALALLICLTGCGRDDTINAQDISKNGEKTATVLIGLGLDSGSPTNGEYILYLYRLNDANKLQRPMQEIRICGTRQSLFPTSYPFTACQPGVITYRLLSVPPGRYTMVALLHAKGNYERGISVVTNFVDPEPGLKFVAIISAPGDDVAHPERSFQVSAGETVYVGDVSFETSSAPFHWRIIRNDEAAQAAIPGHLITYRSIVGPG